MGSRNLLGRRIGEADDPVLVDGQCIDARLGDDALAGLALTRELDAFCWSARVELADDEGKTHRRAGENDELEQAVARKFRG